MEDKKDLFSKVSQKAQEAMQSETAQRAREAAKDLAGAAAQKAQEAMQSETAQKAKAAAGAAAQQAQRAVGEAAAETVQQAQQVYSAAAAGEGLSAVKKARFSKKTVITWGVVILAVIVVLGIIGAMAGGGSSRKQIMQDVEKLLDPAYELITNADLGWESPDSGEQYTVIHKSTFDKDNPVGCMFQFTEEKGRLTEISLFTGSGNPTGMGGMVAGGTALFRAVDSSISEDKAREMLVMGLNGGEFSQEVNGNSFYIAGGSSGYIITVALK